LCSYFVAAVVLMITTELDPKIDLHDYLILTFDLWMVFLLRMPPEFHSPENTDAHVYI